MKRSLTPGRRISLTSRNSKCSLRRRIYFLATCILAIAFAHKLQHHNTPVPSLIDIFGEDTLLESFLALGLSFIPTAWVPVTLPDLYDATVLELQAGLSRKDFTSVDLVKAYLARIDEVNLNGPSLRAVLETNPSALDQARELDIERIRYGPRGPLHGIPVLVKDNMATIASEGMNTTAGSFSLLKSIVPGDAEVITRLRKAGAIILGKTNMSEWADFRGNITSGWSGRGGQCTIAYFPNGDPCGSSSGSAVAASIGLAAVTLGTETEGSITCPSGRNNVVGIKPTVGLTSRTGVIPISEHQDSVGPITRSVEDAAILLNIISGRDTKDSYTFAQPLHVPDFTQALTKYALRGARIGVPRRVFLDPAISGIDSYTLHLFQSAIRMMRLMGATVVDPADLPSVDEMWATQNDSIVLDVDFKIQLDSYLGGLKRNPSGVRSLLELIAFNNANKRLEKPPGFEDQSRLVQSQFTRARNLEFFKALERDKELGATTGIDAALKAHNLDALILPATDFASFPAALAGYPIVTVPLGFYPKNTKPRPAGPLTVYPAPNIPIGLSFIGTAFSESKLIGYAYAYEQVSHTRLMKRAIGYAIPRTQLKDVVSG